jgi:hypothetical protein
MGSLGGGDITARDRRHCSTAWRRSSSEIAELVVMTPVPPPALDDELGAVVGAELEHRAADVRLGRGGA